MRRRWWCVLCCGLVHRSSGKRAARGRRATPLQERSLGTRARSSGCRHIRRPTPTASTAIWGSSALPSLRCTPTLSEGLRIRICTLAGGVARGHPAAPRVGVPAGLLQLRPREASAPVVARRVEVQPFGVRECVGADAVLVEPEGAREVEPATAAEVHSATAETSTTLRLVSATMSSRRNSSRPWSSAVHDAWIRRRSRRSVAVSFILLPLALGREAQSVTDAPRVRGAPCTPVRTHAPRNASERATGALFDRPRRCASV